MSKIIVNKVEPNQDSNLILQGDVTITGDLQFGSDPNKLPPYTIVLGAPVPFNLQVPFYGKIKKRGVNNYEFGLNFGTTTAVVNNPTFAQDWSSLTGWLTNPYPIVGGTPPGINSDFVNAMVQFRPEFSTYPKGIISLYWDWVNNDFVDETEFLDVNGDTLLPHDYNRNHPNYKEVRPGIHIDNFSEYVDSLKNAGLTNRVYLFGNLYLTTSVNTTNPNLGIDSLKNQVNSYRNRQAPEKPINVTYVEMGHEYYLKGNDEPDVEEINGVPAFGGYKKQFPTGTDYGAKYLQYLQEIRSDPQLNNVYCAANLCTDYAGFTPQAIRRREWNGKFIEEYFANTIFQSNSNLHKLDAISIHNFYKVPEVTVNQTVNTFADTGVFENWLLDAADYSYKDLRETYNECLEDMDTASQLHGISYTKPKLWAMGYNLDDGQLTSTSAPAISGCWGHGLFNLVYQFRLMSDPDISVTAFHASHGGRAYGLFFTQTNGFGNNVVGGVSYPTTTPYDLTATGYAFKILREAEQSTKSMRPLSVPGANKFVGIHGMIFYGDLSNIIPGPNTKGASVLLVNLRQYKRTIDLQNIIDPTDNILYYRSLKAPLRAEINKITNGVKTTPTEVLVNRPSASSLITYEMQPYEILHIAIAASNDLAIT